MDYKQVLTDISHKFNIATPEELIAFADEDTIGGYKSGWPVGSIFGVEGQVLYALTRALRPDVVLEFGGFYGCSTAHFLAALEANDNGRVICVDNNHLGIDEIGSQIPEHLRKRWRHIHSEAIEWLENSKSDAKVGIIFEDLDHAMETTRDVWQLGYNLLNPGGVIISHDAMHYIVGRDIRTGIFESQVKDVRFYPVLHPANAELSSDCGLAVARKPNLIENAVEKYTELKKAIEEMVITESIENVVAVKKAVAPLRRPRKSRKVTP